MHYSVVLLAIPHAVTTNKIVLVPAVSEIVGELQEVRKFGVIDLRSGYWQVPITETDRDKTAFTVGAKQFRFKRMPFGLTGTPFTFRRLMLRVLKGLSNTVVYGDDIVVYSESESEHAKHVAAVLHWISEAGLRINGPKSQLVRATVVLLDHKVGQGKIEPIPEKL